MDDAGATPRYEYSISALKQSADLYMSLKSAYGLTVRYAMKANSHPKIIDIFNKKGLHFDASSSYESQLLIDLGIKPSKISLSSQQSAHNLQQQVKAGVNYVAVSKRQVELFAALKERPNHIAIRVNPRTGSGFANRVTTGGKNASFGIWHEYIDEIIKICDSHAIKIDRLQFHIGTGSDPDAWAEMTKSALDIVRKIKTVRTLNLGGGFKYAYHPKDKSADIQSIIETVSNNLQDFNADTGRKIKIEIEPGRSLVAAAGKLIAQIDDIVETGKDGYKFLKLNTGMNDFLRTPMYGAFHKISVLNESDHEEDYIVVGHNCETSDTLTTEIGNPEALMSRKLNRAKIGDLVAIHDTGAYCASMRAIGYNGFPSAQEIFVD